MRCCSLYKAQNLPHGKNQARHTELNDKKNKDAINIIWSGLNI